MSFGLVALYAGATGATALGVGTVGAGIAANLYGQSVQKKANAKAQDQNITAQANQNSAAWSNYLMSRGIAPTSPVAAGVLPTRGNYAPVNVKLPLYATLPSARALAAPAASRWVKRAV